MGIVSPVFAGKRYAVLGLARSGLATVECLLESGARVLAWDSREDARAEVEGRAEIADPLLVDLAGFDGVVVSPGVPLNKHPIAEHARSFGVPVIGDIELFALARPTLPAHKVVGITGTNGKSTTTALVHHIIETAGIATRMGGNIGLPILGQEPLPAGGIYVLELSSYQIDLTFSLDCDVAVLLNVTPDHLDRYESYEAYRESKMRLFRMQSSGHVGIIATGDPAVHEIHMEMIDGPKSWALVTNEASLQFEEQEKWPSLQGPHNAQNIWAAHMTACSLHIHRDIQWAAFATYAALPHRMQRVAERNGVLWVNDSKATNAASTAPALGAYPPIDGKPRIHWIVGGLAKADHLDECVPYYPNIKAAYTIGEAGHKYAELLSPHMPVDDSEMLSAAVRRAARVAEPGDVVLLSPACASFDQFRDYEARGEAFVAAVAALDESEAAADA